MPDITNITFNGTNYTLKASGGGGGGEQVVELTQAQYDALTAYTEDTTYIITDATPINMDDYATTATTSAISTDVATLSGSVANKADKANVTATSSGYYFPLFNAQGIITGTTGTTSLVNFSINGTNYTTYRGGTTAFPNIFAPTSAGTQNAVLLSNGSGAPVWASYKFQFITQTAYDALSTKDSTTIYFITGD